MDACTACLDTILGKATVAIANPVSGRIQGCAERHALVVESGLRDRTAEPMGPTYPITIRPGRARALLVWLDYYDHDRAQVGRPIAALRHPHRRRDERVSRRRSRSGASENLLKYGNGFNLAAWLSIR